MTGAARGIGLELAREFRQAGAEVFIVDFDQAALDEAAAELGVTAIQAD